MILAPETPTTTKCLGETARVALLSWYEEHKDDPYPTYQQKQKLGGELGLTIKQISYWFANKRIRSRKGEKTKKPGRAHKTREEEDDETEEFEEWDDDGNLFVCGGEEKEEERRRTTRGKQKGRGKKMELQEEEEEDEEEEEEEEKDKRG
eukprot:CAMPEP_0201511192 /NCGR_PEP_ID=MMETSP0161_2-20130828/3671_1 /ASSEMBLY_ACC=CAM_ASM_000251 /TAXON_ID=180227 /ORGANISM="Neoparamoeba aestuarina, Strain SoJaBio B1-5/56/2" /LENGTH=149 /DNA_ID=CAMNT_0047906567 /DNA_START=193 /DNA_END=638 /DNA_ORIENTATION=-